MAYIPDTKYITVKRDRNGEIGVFVGGNPATEYYGHKICDKNYVKETFAWMQEQNPEIEEWHIGGFVTYGDGYAKSGNPTAEFGPNVWCRVKLKGKDSSAAPWVYCETYSSASSLRPYDCAYYCANRVRDIEGCFSFGAVVLGLDNAKNNQVKQKENKMAYIPDTKYITVKRDRNGEIGFFVGGKPATEYYGEEICDKNWVKETFAWMQERNPEIEEWHIGAFATAGEYARAGNPDGKCGLNAWCRVKKKNSSAAPWVFAHANAPVPLCTHYCTHHVRNSPSFRVAVLGPKIDNAKNNNAQGVMSPVTAPAEQFELVQGIREGNLKITIERLKTNNK